MADDNSLTLAFLATIRRGRMKFRCRPCGRTAYEAHSALRDRYGGDMTVGRLKARIPCWKCGRRVDGDLVTLDLDLEPRSREYALRNIWGGVDSRAQLAALVAERKARGEPEPDW